MMVTTHHDPDQDFSGLQTYEWKEGAGGVRGELRLEGNRMLDRRIKSIIDEALHDRGYRRVEGGNPDFQIGYVAALEGKVAYGTVDDYFRYRRRAVWVTGVETVEYDEGTLVLDISDGSTGDPIWRGSAEAELHDDSREYREQKLREAVTRLLDRFPPVT